jgi:hypothetical protein
VIVSVCPQSNSFQLSPTRTKSDRPSASFHWVSGVTPDPNLAPKKDLVTQPSFHKRKLDGWSNPLWHFRGSSYISSLDKAESSSHAPSKVRPRNSPNCEVTNRVSHSHIKYRISGRSLVSLFCFVTWPRKRGQLRSFILYSHNH